jgi:hypothetical protein
MFASLLLDRTADGYDCRRWMTTSFKRSIDGGVRGTWTQGCKSCLPSAYHRGTTAAS